MQLAPRACKICMRLAASHIYIVPEWPPVAYKLYPNGRQSHATWIKSIQICMQLAEMWVQFACNWRPLGYNLYVTGCHSVTRQETCRQEVCKRPSLHHIYIFLALASPHPRRLLPTIQLTALGYLVWKMRWYYGWHSHTEANFVRASGQLRAKPPVFCKHAARTIIWIKNEDAIKKSENLHDTCP